MSLEIRPLPNGFGAEVFNAPPTLEMDEAVFRQIEAAWYAHSILVFHGLKMSPPQHIAFTKRLGPLHFMEPPNITLPDHPEVFVVSNATQDGRPVGLKRAGEGFHSDGEDKAIPNAGSFLYAIAVPPERGDTLFADMYRVYEALPDDIKRKLEGRRARFSRIDLHHIHYPLMAPLTEEQKRKRPDVYHPILRKHPKTGRTALYLGRWACDIEGLPPHEGRALIKDLQDFAQQERFLLRQRWQVGDAVLWDNRCTQHCATGFDDEKYVRTMYRTTLEGEAPLMAGTGERSAA
jgi:alpha-ketoglutarate-dependent taurine dioxygenase